MVTWWSSPGEAEALQALVDVFNTGYTGLDFINIDSLAGDNEELFDIVEARNTAGTPPEVVHALPRDYPAWMETGRLESLDWLYAEEGLETLRKRNFDLVILDVRTPEEYAEGHLEGAINIPLRELAQNLDMIPTDRQVFVYCKSGWRAGIALSSLGMMGYDNVLAFPPGWNGWTEAGEPVTTDVPDAATTPSRKSRPTWSSTPLAEAAGCPPGCRPAVTGPRS